MVITVLLSQLDNTKTKKRVKEIEEEVKEIEESRIKSKKVLEDSIKETKGIKDRVENRRERAKERKERVKQVGKITLIILSIIGGAVLGGAKVYGSEITYCDIPFEKYVEMVELANFYKTLYEETEADLAEADTDNEALLKQVELLQGELNIRINNEEILQKRMEELMDTITKLLRNKSINVKGGIGAKYDCRIGIHPPEAFAFVVVEWDLFSR